jgi:RES domain-containing protein
VPQAFRITKRDYADLSGLGGVYRRGRWHSEGQPIIYCGTNRATALLEFMVHFEVHPRDLSGHVIMCIPLADDLEMIEILETDLDRADPDWRAPDSDTCRRIGDIWLQRGRLGGNRGSPLLLVPSAVLGGERNILVNPLHPAFSAALAVSDPPGLEPLEWDPRRVELISHQALAERRKSKP